MRYHRRRRVVSLVSALTLVTGAGCGGDASPSSAPLPNGLSAAANTYLNSALDIMQAQSFYRAKLDWKALRAASVSMAASAKAQTPAETYPAIRSALAALGDHHSFLQNPVASAERALPGFPGSGSMVMTLAQFADSLDGEIIGGRYGYVRVPTYAPANGGTAAQSAAFADTLQGLVRAVDTHAPCGWVVDLRHNHGGNMWPMLAGIGPIVGEGTRLGSFLDATGSSTYWYYLNGASGINAPAAPIQQAAVSRGAYTLRNPSPPVAVLTDAQTASSGEAITVAFRGRAGARSFGAATYGVPTANSGFPLSDGAEIWLTVALDVDRTGTQYVDPIPPDEVIATTAAPATDDATAAAAMNWLSTQATCVGSSSARDSGRAVAAPSSPR